MHATLPLTEMNTCVKIFENPKSIMKGRTDTQKDKVTAIKLQPSTQECIVGISRHTTDLTPRLSTINLLQTRRSQGITRQTKVDTAIVVSNQNTKNIILFCTSDLLGFQVEALLVTDGTGEVPIIKNG